MIVSKKVETPQHIDITMFKDNTKVRVVYDGKHKNLIKFVEISTSSSNTVPDVRESVVVMGAATYKKVSNSDYETHVKKAVAHVLRVESDNFAVISKEKLHKLEHFYELES